MNGSVREQFVALVEQCVQPVFAFPAHKSRMREELLVHLLFAYEEELAERQNEPEALEATRRRFGTADNLRWELQTAVPWWEVKLVSGGHGLLAILGSYQSEGIMRVLVILASLILLMVGMGFIMPAVAHWRLHGGFSQVAFFLLGVLIAGGGIGSFITWGLRSRRT